MTDPTKKRSRGRPVKRPWPEDGWEVADVQRFGDGLGTVPDDPLACGLQRKGTKVAFPETSEDTYQQENYYQCDRSNGRNSPNKQQIIDVGAGTQDVPDNDPFESTRSDYNNQCHSTYGCAEPPPLRLHISNGFSKAVVMALPQRGVL